MKKLTMTILAGLLALPLAASASTFQPTQTPGPYRSRIAHPHNDWLSAQRALKAAKLFLAKAANDSAGQRTKAQVAVEQALAAVNSAVKAQGLQQ